jgi:hypothetical protein
MPQPRWSYAPQRNSLDSCEVSARQVRAEPPQWWRKSNVVSPAPLSTTLKVNSPALTLI